MSFGSTENMKQFGFLKSLKCHVSYPENQCLNYVVLNIKETPIFSALETEIQYLLKQNIH